MRRRLPTLSRALWMACACLCLLPRLAAAAEPSLVIDFDGDGRHDHVMLDGRQPSLLHVWKHRPNGFHRYRPRHDSPQGLTSPTSRRIDGGEEEPAGLPDSTFVPSALVRAAPHAPTNGASRICAPHGTPACHRSPAVQPFAPRPPPASLRS
jgi:hypothetical protein